MKTYFARLVLAACIVGLVLLVAPGCASLTIGAASTELSVPTPRGPATLKLPKEVDAIGLDLAWDQENGEVRLKAQRLRTSSRGLIDSAVAGQTAAIGEAGNISTTLVPLLTPKQ